MDPQVVNNEDIQKVYILQIYRHIHFYKVLKLSLFLKSEEITNMHISVWSKVSSQTGDLEDKATIWEWQYGIRFNI